MVEVRVTNLAQSLAFYVKVLGLAIRLHDLAGGFALLGDGPAHVALKVGVASGMDRGSMRLVFEVADLDAERARIQEHGIEISEIVENRAESYREARLHDPDGTLISFFAWM